MPNVRASQAPVALVAGGAQGIGRAIVEERLAAGARVLALDVDAATLADLDLATWQRVLDVNLTGAYLVARAAAPHLSPTRPASSPVTRWWWTAG